MIPDVQANLSTQDVFLKLRHEFSISSSTANPYMDLIVNS